MVGTVLRILAWYLIFETSSTTTSFPGSPPLPAIRFVWREEEETLGTRLAQQAVWACGFQVVPLAIRSCVGLASVPDPTTTLFLNDFY